MSGGDSASQPTNNLSQPQAIYPGKFVAPDQAFSAIHRGDRIFIGTGCGYPQYLIDQLVAYTQAHPKAFFDAEVLHVWTLGVNPYLQDDVRRNFRLNSFFVSGPTRDSVNQGVADYTPIFLSQVPSLLTRGVIPIDIALVQTSLPDEHGYVSLGISVDIVRTAVDCARTVICQMNPQMPRTHGDSFLHLTDIDYAIVHQEPLLELASNPADEVADRIGEYVSRLVEDGATIQVGYGRIPDAIVARLAGKKHLGVHTELLSDGIVALMKAGVVDNTRKNIDRNKTVASFCMGSRATYEYLNDNPSVSFRAVDYTNSPAVISQIEKMTAINSALEIDLTGQATAESLNGAIYSGVGGQPDFMRGAVLAPAGKSVLVIPSTARDGTVSRIVPVLSEGAGITLTRSDVHYVVTEYGIAYLHGKNLRERAMELIRIAHPNFRLELLRAAKARHLIYADQAFVPGSRGEYPEHLETYRTAKSGIELLLRPVRISDEPLLKDFFYALSDRSVYQRFISARKDMPHERLQEFVIIDYSSEIVILALEEIEGIQTVVGVAQYGVEPDSHTAEVALVVRDDFQKQGIGTELLAYVTLLAKREGLLGFRAEVLVENQAMMHLFETAGFSIDKKRGAGVYELRMLF
ncbi:GNAT family N-acetyltransferase [Candidatus Bipolaricaulota bacterium]|nr:GNAT family N-acetyltransferase [Candidatus Bipolaricaulota bacterium]TFH08807.1 MAG: GNAT family N-acetyltransferase [Candidatus Atribacteria bacterium]